MASRTCTLLRGARTLIRQDFAHKKARISGLFCERFSQLS
jgi:hypothetical protein